MMFNPDLRSAAPARRFALIIMGLLRSVGARAIQNLLTGGYPGVGMARLPMPMAELIHARFNLAGARFAALAERVRLGTARVFAHRAAASRGAPAPGAGSPAAPAPDAACAAARLPRGFGGVLGLLHWEAARFADSLRQQLSDPESVVLIQSAPGFARILRPLCRMLAIVPPPGLFPPLPKRARRRACRPATASPPSRRAGRVPGAGLVAADEGPARIRTRPGPDAECARPRARGAGRRRKTW